MVGKDKKKSAKFKGQRLRKTFCLALGPQEHLPIDNTLLHYSFYKISLDKHLPGVVQI